MRKTEYAELTGVGEIHFHHQSDLNEYARKCALETGTTILEKL
jgi:hypothetical protein